MGRTLRQTFARVYCGDSLGIRSIISRDVTRYARSVQTVVVDTEHLTTGVQHLKASWTLPEDTGNPVEVAHRATAHSSSMLMRGLHHATATHKREAVDSVSAGSGEVEWTAQHLGGHFVLSAAGNVGHILHFCELTENENERIIVTARKLIHQGYIVYAVATSEGASDKPQVHRMHFGGLVACSLDLLPNTHGAIEYLRTHLIRLVYITSLPEDLATQIAHAAHLTTHPKIARHSQFVSDTSHSIYAHADRVNSRRIVQNLPQPLLIAQHPIGEITAMIEAYR